MKKLALAAAIGGLGAIAAPAMAAPTVGDTLSCTASGFACSSNRATMGSGTEFTGNISGFSMLSFDFSQGLLTISNRNPWDLSFAGRMSFRFEDLTSAFSSVSLISQSGFGNTSAGNFAVDNGVLSFSTTSFFSAGSNASLVLQVGNAPAVPEPAAWTMMILGFGLAGYALRQRRARVAVSA